MAKNDPNHTYHLMTEMNTEIVIVARIRNQFLKIFLMKGNGLEPSGYSIDYESLEIRMSYGDDWGPRLNELLISSFEHLFGDGLSFTSKYFDFMCYAVPIIMSAARELFMKFYPSKHHTPDAYFRTLLNSGDHIVAINGVPITLKPPLHDQL